MRFSAIASLAFIALTAVAQTPDFAWTQTPQAVDITHAGARIISSTYPATVSVVVWDAGDSSHSHPSATCTLTGSDVTRNPCSAYPNHESNWVYHGVNDWFIGGAPAGSTVYYRVCSAVGSWTCSSEASFTTLAEPPVHPAPAALPATVPNPSVPTKTGSVWTYGTNCSSFLDCWNKATSCNDTIVIPHNKPIVETNGIYGQSPLPVKSCTVGNELLIETDQAGFLPPPGSRISPLYLPMVASIEPSVFYYYDTTPTGGITPFNGNCHPGAYMWLYNGNAPGFAMQQCVQNSTTHTITNITGCDTGGQATGCTVTTADAHGFSGGSCANNVCNGDIVYVNGVLGIPLANGTCRIMTVIDSTHFTMNCSAGFVDRTNSYTSGGTVRNHVWQSVTAQSVSLVGATFEPPSGSCSPEGAFGYDSAPGGTPLTQNWDGAHGAVVGVTSSGSVVRCVYDESGTNLVWRRWQVWMYDPTITPSATFTLDFSGSSGIYLLGIRLASQRIPPEPLFLRDGGQPEGTSAFQGGRESASFVHTSIGSSNITLDRCIIDGIDYPRGFISGPLKLDGNNISLINSYLTGAGQWFGAQDRGPRLDNFATAAIIRSAGVGFLEQNNYLEGYGLTTHLDDAQGGVYIDSDITVNRNTFYRNPTHFFGHSANAAAYPATTGTLPSLGVYWPLRQLWETKECTRCAITGNTFTNNWKNVSGAIGLFFSPRMEASPWFGQGAIVVGGNKLDWEGRIPVTNLQANGWLACSMGLDPSTGASTFVDKLYQILSLPDAHSVVTNTLFPGSDWYGLSGTINTSGTGVTISGATFPADAANQIITITATGTVNTSGTTATSVSGATFGAGMTGSQINIASVNYIIDAVVSSTTLTLHSSAGTQTGASFSLPVQYNIASVTDSTHAVLSSNAGVQTGSAWVSVVRSTQCAPADMSTGITDITITNNTFTGLPNSMGGVGSQNSTTTTIGNAIPAPLQRFTATNNLHFDILDDGSRQDPLIWQSNGGGFVYDTPSPFGQDVVSRHETHSSIGGPATEVFAPCAPPLCGTFSKSTEGLAVENNVTSMRDPSTCPIPSGCATHSPITHGGDSGSSLFSDCCVSSTLANNLYQMVGGDPTGYPGSVAWKSTPSQLGFADVAHGNFRLRYDSPGKSGQHMSSDGLDVGADIDALERAQGAVTNVRAISIASTSATIAFMAPDSNGCTVDWGTDPTFATYTRVSNAGGARIQSVNLSSLPSHTAISYRVNCAVMQPIGAFSTRN